MTIIDIRNRKTHAWQTVDLRDLHPYAAWEEDEELPIIEIDTHSAEPFDDPDFTLDDGLDHIVAVQVDTHERETAEIVEITNLQLLHRRLHEAVDPTWR